MRTTAEGVKLADMDPVWEAVFDLTDASLFRAGPATVRGADWERVKAECRTQGVLPLTLEVAQKSGAPKEVALAWEREAGPILIGNGQNLRAHVLLHDLLSKAGIPYVILKGAASGAYYPRPVLRSYGDVDFLVREEDISRSDALLIDNGFRSRPGHDEHPFHQSYAKQKKPYELHWGVGGVPSDERGDPLRAFFSDLIDSAVPMTGEAGTFMAPTPRHHAVILLLHTANHLRYSGIGFRHICDWAVFLHKEKELLAEMAQTTLPGLGLRRFAQILTALCASCFSLELPEWAFGTDPLQVKELLEDIMTSGNFGWKEEGSTGIARNYAERARREGKGKAWIFFRMLNDSAKASVPIAEDIPALLPVGWVAASGKYVGRLLTGKRNVSKSMQTMQDAERRKDMFSSWGLFEKEG